MYVYIYIYSLDYKSYYLYCYIVLRVTVAYGRLLKSQ
jgi:hypothetical protein